MFHEEHEETIQLQLFQVVVERQKLMADQIKLRRKQKREKAMVERTQETSTPQNDSDSGEIITEIFDKSINRNRI